MSSRKQLDASRRLIATTKEGNAEAINRIVQKNALDVNHCFDYSCYNRVPILWATINNHNDCVNTLIDLKANVNVIDGSEEFAGATPLIIASTQNNTLILELLLKAQADVSVRERRHNHSALLAAASKGYIEAVQIFVSYGVSLTTDQDSNGSTALSLAIENGHLDFLTYLLTAKASPLDRDGNQLTAVMTAARSGQSQALLLLLGNKYSSDDLNKALLANDGSGSTVSLSLAT